MVRRNGEAPAARLSRSRLSLRLSFSRRFRRLRRACARLRLCFLTCGKAAREKSMLAVKIKIFFILPLLPWIHPGLLHRPAKFSEGV